MNISKLGCSPQFKGTMLVKTFSKIKENKYDNLFYANCDKARYYTFDSKDVLKITPRYMTIKPQEYYDFDPIIIYYNPRHMVDADKQNRARLAYEEAESKDDDSVVTLDFTV